MPADGTKATHLTNGTSAHPTWSKLLETIQQVPVCVEGDSLPFPVMAPLRRALMAKGSLLSANEAGACTGHTHRKTLRRYKNPASATASSSPTAWARRLPAPGVR